MNQISMESNVVETDISEFSTLGTVHTEDAIKELNSAQLALVGGGAASILLI